MSTATIDRTDLTKMMQRPKERGDDPCDDSRYRRFDWKLPPPVPTERPKAAVLAALNPAFPAGTTLRPAGAHPRFVDAGGVTWWRCWYSEMESRGEEVKRG